MAHYIGRLHGAVRVGDRDSVIIEFFRRIIDFNFAWSPPVMPISRMPGIFSNSSFICSWRNRKESIRRKGRLARASVPAVVHRHFVYHRVVPPGRSPWTLATASRTLRIEPSRSYASNWTTTLETEFADDDVIVSMWVSLKFCFRIFS